MYDSKDLLSIGEVSRLCRISVKTLRYYDEIGLLKPTYVNSASKYRYYSKSQLPYIMIVKELRALGHSLDDIQKFSRIVDIEEKNTVLVDEKLTKITKQMEKLEKERQQHLAYKAFFEYLKNIQYDNISVKHNTPGHCYLPDPGQNTNSLRYMSGILSLTTLCMNTTYITKAP